MRLKYQLFLTLLSSGALLIALMVGFARWNFDRGFLDYIGEIERRQLEPMVAALADRYADERSWDWLSDDRSAWSALMASHLGRGARGRPPDTRDRSRSALERERSRNAEPSGIDRPAKRPAAGVGPVTFDPRLLLADADRTVLIGRDKPDRPVRWQSIELDGTTIGYLGHRAVDVLPDSIDEAFAARQRRGFAYAALALVILSALLAVPLAARLVRPLTDVADGVERIGRGDYAHRVPVERRDEIGTLARDVNRLAASLDATLKARQRWLAEVSHELRTPVAVLRGELEALQDGVRILDAAAVDSLHAESLRLGRLIDDLHTLTLADADALDYRFEALDLRRVLSDRLESGRTVLAERQISVERDTSPNPLRVRGDAQRLGQLVDNLVQNTSRHTDTGGRLSVSLGQDERDAVLTWSDSAPGVDAAHLAHLFDPLYRVESSRTRDAGGAGLGLAIAARIVAAHDGTISAASSALGGLTIRVTVPLTGSQPA